jgi:hypothetical protein
MRTDWLPASRAGQLAMAKRWLELLPERIVIWSIPEHMVTWLKNQTRETETAYERANSSEATKGDIARVRTRFQELVNIMRRLRRRYFFLPPLTEGDYADLGLQLPDTVRTPHIDVHEMVDFVIHLSNIRELVVDFWIQGEAHKAKPNGYDGAVIIWGVTDAPPENPTDLPNHTMASKTPHSLTFDEGQRGKTVQIALAWQNERGHLGQWSEYKSAIIP